MYPSDTRLILKHRILLEISSIPDGYTLGELSEKFDVPKREIAKVLGEFEIFGLIRGTWTHRQPDNRWVRKYVITGDGVQSFIDQLNLKIEPVDYPDLM